MEKSNLKSMLINLNELQAEYFPLEKHSALAKDIHCRSTYAVLLAASVLSCNTVSKEQNRLFAMLLTSLGVGDNLGGLYTQASKMTKQQLKESIDLLKSEELEISFLTDALMICRLHSPFSDEQNQLFSEIVSICDIARKDVDAVVDVCKFALGINNNIDIYDDFDYGKVIVWREFLLRPLSSERLESGKLTGCWLVDSRLVIDKEFYINNAYLKFCGDGAIEFETDDGGFVFKIESTTLQNPLIKLSNHDIWSGDSDFVIDNCTVLSDYKKPTLKTCFDVRGRFRTKVNKSLFKTLNSRSFFLGETFCEGTVIDGCVFEGCGSGLLDGGALLIEHSRFAVKHSKFINCIAKNGGALFLNSVSDSSEIFDVGFEDCGSDFSLSGGKNGINSGVAVFVKDFTDRRNVHTRKGIFNNSSFNKSSFLVKYIYVLDNFNCLFGRCRFSYSLVGVRESDFDKLYFYECYPDNINEKGLLVKCSDSFFNGI